MLNYILYTQDQFLLFICAIIYIYFSQILIMKINVSNEKCPLSVSISECFGTTLVTDLCNWGALGMTETHRDRTDKLHTFFCLGH